MDQLKAITVILIARVEIDTVILFSEGFKSCLLLESLLFHQYCDLLVIVICLDFFAGLFRFRLFLFFLKLFHLLHLFFDFELAHTAIRIISQSCFLK